MADITNTVNYATVVRWETDVGGKNHADMPQYKWQMLLLGYTLYKAKPVEKERERGE